jgi:hypothetical protein
MSDDTSEREINSARLAREREAEQSVGPSQEPTVASLYLT